MSSEFGRRRARNPLQLMVRTAPPSGDSEAGRGSTRPVLPGWVRALIAGLGTGVGGWLLVSVPVLLGWVLDRTGEIGPVFGAANQIWLLAHGGGLQIGGVRWTLAPLGITFLLLLQVALVTALLVRRAGSEGPPSHASAWRTPAMVATAYALVVLMTGLALGSPLQAVRAGAGALALAGVGAVWGAARVSDLGLLRSLPVWARAVPAAAAAAVGTVLVAGATALAISILLHRERIIAIADGLGADGGNAAYLVIAQLVFLPNLVIWAAAWVLGGGFTVGAGTLVSPPGTDLGLLPSIPVLGALPAEGAGQGALGWLIVGIVAGALAGVVVLRRRPTAGLDETAGVAFVAGLVALGALTGLALLSRGDLGVARLTGLGPRIPELLMTGGPLLVLPAVSVGVLGGIVRHWRGERHPQPPPDAETEESTRVVRATDDAQPTVRVRDRVKP